MTQSTNAGPRTFNSFVVILAILFLAGSTFVTCNGCEVSDDEATQTIESAGLKRPILGPRAWGGCAKSEASRQFVARNSDEKLVEGIVCCGLLTKGCTIRWGAH